MSLNLFKKCDIISGGKFSNSRSKKPVTFSFAPSKKIISSITHHFFYLLKYNKNKTFMQINFKKFAKNTKKLQKILKISWQIKNLSFFSLYLKIKTLLSLR